MKLKFSFLLLIPFLCAGSSLVTQTARDVLEHSQDCARAEVFLEQAIVENPGDPEPLTLLAVLKSADLKDNPDQLTSQVGPMLTRLLAIREQDPATKPSDLALALELNARFLNQLDRAWKLCLSNRDRSLFEDSSSTSSGRRR